MGNTNKLCYLIDNDLTVACQLLSTDRFISFCRERGVFTYSGQLEQFEKLGLFYPLARVQYPKLRIKIEYTEDRQHYRDLGILKDGEQWEGDTLEEYAGFSFEKDCAEDYLKDNLLWEPHTRPFQPWKTFIDEDGGRQIESFYSRFQIYILYRLLKLTTYQVNVEWLEYPEYKDRILEDANSIIPNLPKLVGKNDNLVFICQVISNRYFFHSQSDRRTITVTSPIRRTGEWDWHAYCRRWDSKAVLVDLGIGAEELKTMHENLQRYVKHLDPVENWYEIISFMSVEQRQRLKGEAALAQELYIQEIMLRLFYKDITGEKLPAPDESWDWDREVYYGKNAIENQLIYLELLTNKYHLNPKPRLILVVEGEGEFRQFPRLARQLFGSDFPTLGIRIVQLEGVGGFTGRKKNDKYGALEKLIDDYHYRQIFVFVVLDDEGGASNTKRRLVSAQSRLYPKRRVTKEDYIHIWRKNIEFDNFTHDEIAEAMSIFSDQVGRAYKFESDEIAECERQFDRKKRDWLSIVFKEKCGGYELNKPELLRILFDRIITNPAKEVDENGEPIRPIVQLMKTIITLAGRNHQPIRFDRWEENQESGYFGELIK